MACEFVRSKSLLDRAESRPLSLWICCGYLGCSADAAPFTLQALSVGPSLARVLQKRTAASPVENKMGAQAQIRASALDEI